MTNSQTDYKLENVNPNTYLHNVLYCDRCGKPIALISNFANEGNRVCYPCYKKLLEKN